MAAKFNLWRTEQTHTVVYKRQLIGRSRPTELKLIEQGGYSFPSGHTMFAEMCIRDS